MDLKKDKRGYLRGFEAMKGMEKCNYIHLKKEKLKRKEKKTWCAERRCLEGSGRAE